MRTSTRILSSIAILHAAAIANAADIHIRYLANASIELSDSESTIYIDFPYESGAYNFMTYDISIAKPVGKTLCLITHKHEDHFESKLIDEFGCQVLGPPDVVAQVKNDRILPMHDGTAHFGAAVITAIETPHADMGHYSYRIDWAGQVVYFVGDTDQPSFVYEETDLDILFVTPWLLGASMETEIPLPAKQVVVYHHRGPPKWECGFCIIPVQGQNIELPQ